MDTTLITAFSILTLGLLMLIGGGELLITQASKLARKLGMPPFVVGLTIIAFGTSVPELFISLTAALQDHYGIMIGNIVGSNIANIGLILGCCALIAPLPMQFSDIRSEIFIVLGASILVMACSAFGFFPRLLGIASVLTLAGYTYFIYSRNTNKNEKESDDETGRPTSFNRMPTLAPLMILGLLLLAMGSKFFIDGAVTIARHFEISELVIGLTLAAIGTSLPELASSIAALRQKQAGMLIGNVVGSNMFNLLMVFGISGMIRPFPMERALLTRDLPIMLAFTAILIPILLPGGTIKRWHGAILLAAYAGYIISLA